MTWFRVGGAGIPAALKNAMNAVFNKKFGTSGQNYPPKQWPDDVNLMGPLPEGTASGSIANITDGADQVPIKTWNSNVDANASGVSNIECTKIASNNLASMSDADFTLNSVRYKTENGVLYIDGTSTGETSSNNDNFKALDFWLPSGTYYFNRGSLSDLNVATYLRKYDDKSQIAVNAGSFTLSERTHLYVAFYVYQKTFSNIKAEICINIGSTAITYTDTTAAAKQTVDLGRTIYGGSVELIDGTGTDENGVDFTFDPILPIPETENVCNFWTNVGSSSIVYRRDIDLALQAVSSSRGLMMASRPVTQLVGEESDPDQVNELVENDETEQEGEDDAR